MVAEEATSRDLVDVCAVFRERAPFLPEIRKGLLAGAGKCDMAKAAPEVAS